MSSITELKTIISGFEEDITSEAVESFEEVISQIRSSYESTPSIITLLKMLRALGKYLEAKKKNVHQDSWPLLNSITENLEKFVEEPDMGEDSVNEIMSDQINEYRIFQKKIISSPKVSDEDLDSLKEVILAIDWEISDVTLSDFETVLSRLIEKFKAYRIHYIFLKIIYTTGKFIGIQKADAPSDSIAFLRSVFDHFQEMVDADNISLEDKKAILAEDLSRFQEFKQSVYSSKTDMGSEDLEQEMEEMDEFESDVAPALSHLGSESEGGDEEFVPLTEMPEDDGQLSSLAPTDRDDSEPEADQEGKEDSGQKDVMDDLFSVKETPADELLDAIHLMEVHGEEKGEVQAMQMLDQSGPPQAGLKNFTAEKKGDAPIPEIDSRLDEFFSLDTSGMENVDKFEVPEPEEELTESVVESEGEPEAEDLVPFEPEQESYDESIGPDQEIEPELSDQTVLNRLKITLETKEFLEDKSILSSVSLDVQSLRKFWGDDTQKQSLLDIISVLLDLPAIQPDIVDSGSSEESSGSSMQDNAVEPDIQSDGIWGKIKSMFSR